MADKQLRFMDKTQLLNIMRQQELEIERLETEVEQLNTENSRQIDRIEKLNGDKDRQIDRLNTEIEKLSAEVKDNKNQSSDDPEKDKQIEILIDEVERLTSDKNEQIERLTVGLKRLNTEKDEEIERLNAEIQMLNLGKDMLADRVDNAKNEEIERLKAEIQMLNLGKDAMALRLDADIDEQTEKLNAEIIRLNSEVDRIAKEKDELAKSFEEQQGQYEQQRFAAPEIGSLAEASVSVSGIMKAAQDAADVYLNNIKVFEEEKKAEAEKIENEARKKAAIIIKAAEVKRDEIEKEERKALNDLRCVSFLFTDYIDKSHSALHEMIQKYKLIQLPQTEEPKDLPQINGLPKLTEDSFINQ